MKIIVAEDEQRSREGLCEMIQSLGDQYEIVATAVNGKQGLDLIRSLQPDVVFTDIKMPYLSGIDLLKAARENHFSCRFVLISAYAEFQYAKEAMQLGCDDYILKPPMKSELKKTLEHIENILKYGTSSTEKEDSIAEKYPDAHKFVIRTLRIIESGYKGNLNQQIIAEQMNITPEYLSYLFSRDIGITFAKFIKEYRIQKAVQLLKSGEVSIRDIPYEVGFTDRKYFNKVFHEIKGESLSSYMSHL